MLGGDCKYADFQMFDKTVQKHQKKKKQFLSQTLLGNLLCGDFTKVI